MVEICRLLEMQCFVRLIPTFFTKKFPFTDKSSTFSRVVTRRPDSRPETFFAFQSGAHWWTDTNNNEEKTTEQPLTMTQQNKTTTISSLNEAKHWQVFGVSQRKVLKNKDCKASAFFQNYIWKTSNQSSSATRTVWSGWRSCATSKPTHISPPLTKRWRWLFPPTVVLPFFTGDL